MANNSKRQKVKLNTKIYIITLSLLWATLFTIVSRNSYPVNLFIILAWGVLQFFLESFYVKLKKGATSSVTFATIFASIILFGPLTAATIALFQGITLSDLKKIREANPLRWLFNSVQESFSAIISGLTYVSLGGLIFIKTNSVFTLNNFTSQIIPLLTAIAVFYLTNTLLVSIAISLNDGISIKNLWKISFSWGDLNYVALGFLGIIIAQIYFLEPLALILLISPLAVARQTFSRYMKLEKAYSSTISALVKAIEAKDPYTKGHSERVADICAQIGTELNLSASEIESLRRIASLHDIGKIGIPKSILLKPARLSKEEYALIQEHPRIGSRILKDVPFLKELIPAVYYHHEKMDGSGYNSGLKGKKIPLYARIIAIADSYDAMTSDRAYRKALSKEAVLSQLISNSQTQFDSKIVKAFLNTPEATKNLNQENELLITH